MSKLAAHYLGRYRGRRYYRYPVLVWQCGELVESTTVDSDSAAAAAELVRDEYRYEGVTEVVAYGPEGGITIRGVGFEGAVAGAMFSVC